MEIIDEVIKKINGLCNEMNIDSEPFMKILIEIRPHCDLADKIINTKIFDVLDDLRDINKLIYLIKAKRLTEDIIINLKNRK